MKYYKEYHTTGRSIETIECDICGFSVDPYALPSEDDNVFEAQEFRSIRGNCGYGSVFGARNIIEIDLCQHCLKDKLGTWIRVTKGDVL